MLLSAVGITDLSAQVMAPFNNLKRSSFTKSNLPMKIKADAVPSTLTVKSIEVEDQDFTSYFEIIENNLVGSDLLSTLPDSVLNGEFIFTYRVFQGNWKDNYRLLDTSIILAKWDPTLADFTSNYNANPIIVERNNMTYRGAFTRGISLGNNQDLTLNSAFNLQLSGELGDGIKITGALSDNSIPIQPEGNSQQLQEFDKIFIVLSNKNSSLTIGDFEINKPPGYFLNYFKKLQGVQVANTTVLKKNNILSTSGGVAITKGKFNRFTVQVIEGNQGPYRLPGAEGELFVIVLAGTERVYLDGVILSRGYDRDYIIDYNSGEVTFMPSRIITKDSRIVVEYEYSNQQYLRSFYNLNVNYNTKKWNFNFNSYSEQDGKNSARGRDLTAEDKLALGASGDSINNTLVNSIREIEPSNKSIVVSYSLIDTTVNGKLFSILKFPWQEGSTRYIADFTDVGARNGYYNRVNEGVNGRVYRFVGEDAAGRPLGQYNPLSKLTAPNRKQMFTFGTTWKVDSNTIVTAEGALSGLDNNRFSAKDDGDNQGMGLNINIVKNNMIFRKKGNWKGDVGIMYERVDKDFNIINPYRNQEFTRDWNITNIVKETQHLGRAFLNQRFGKKLYLNYGVSGLFQDIYFQGIKQEASIGLTLKKTTITTNISYLNSQSPTERSQFSRPSATITQQLPKLGNMIISLSYQSEFNKRASVVVDTLLASSFAFQILRLSIVNNFTKNIATEVYTQRRNDYQPFSTELDLANHAQEYGLKTSIKQGQGSVLNLSGTVRTFEIDRYKSTLNLTSKNTYLGQLDYLFSTFKNRLSGNTLFEVSSGQEQKTEFNYIAVQPGTGQYIWNDYNNDSIQQINEFTTEGFAEMRNFTRVNILSNQFIPTLNTSFNQSLRWNGKSASGQGKVKFINKFSTQSSFRFDRKIRDNARVGFWNPFYTNIPDSSLVTFIRNFRHTFFFNRGDSKYEFQASMNNNNSKNVLTTGFEKRRNDQFNFTSRFNIGVPVSLFFFYTCQYKFSESEATAFQINNYSIKSDEFRPEVNWLIGEKFRFSSTYRLLLQKNRLAPLFEKATSNDISLKLDFNESAKSSFKFSTTMAIIKYNGLRNSAVEFAMLEGLKNGRNYLWSISYDHNLKNNVQLNFGYDGRKSEGINAVHTGRASVKAYF